MAQTNKFLANDATVAEYRAIMGLMGLYGGEPLPDVVVGEHNEHRVWINTKK